MSLAPFPCSFSLLFPECEKKRIITDLYNEKIEADLVVESTTATEEQKAA